MESQNNFSIIAPCGMNCSICMAYLRGKNKCPGCRGIDDGIGRSEDLSGQLRVLRTSGYGVRSRVDYPFPAENGPVGIVGCQRDARAGCSRVGNGKAAESALLEDKPGKDEPRIAARRLRRQNKEDPSQTDHGVFLHGITPASNAALPLRSLNHSRGSKSAITRRAERQTMPLGNPILLE